MKIYMIPLILILLSSFAFADNESGTGYLWYDDFDAITSWTDNAAWGSGELVVASFQGENRLKDVGGGASGLYLNSVITPDDDGFCIQYLYIETAAAQYGYLIASTNGNYGNSADSYTTWIATNLAGTDTRVDVENAGAMTADNGWITSVWYKVTQCYKSTYTELYINDTLYINYTNAANTLSNFVDIGFRADGVNSAYFDKFKVWAGNFSDEPIPAPPPPSHISITLDYPDNNTHYSGNYSGYINISLTGVNVSATCIINNSGWILNTTSPFGNETVSWYNSNYENLTGNFSIAINCTDNSNTAALNFSFIADSVDVIATLNIINNSIIADPFVLNVSYYDIFLYQTNTTIVIEDTGQVIHNNYSGNLAYGITDYYSIYYLNLTNTTFMPGYNLLIYVEGTDTHTAKKFKEKPEKTKIQVYKDVTNDYNMKHGRFSIHYKDDIKIDEIFAYDRMQFKITANKKNTVATQYIDADKIVYYPESEYACHFIINDNYWYDCEGLTEPKVKKIYDNLYEIKFIMPETEAISRSLGGLNAINTVYNVSINQNFTGDIHVGDFFNPPNSNFNYTSLYNFTVDSLYLDGDSITITGSNISAFDGVYNYNLTDLELENVVLFAGATPIDCYIDLVTNIGDINNISYQWYNKTNDILESGYNLCDSDNYCTLDELSGSETNINDSVTCRAIINNSWFNFAAISDTINTTRIDLCGADIMYPIINITYRDEIDDSLINTINSYNLTFYEGTSTFDLNYNGTGNYTSFCTDTNPVDAVFNLNMYGNLILSSPNYITRIYDIPSELGILVSNNPYTNFSFYLIGVSNSSTITYTWRTTDYNTVDGTMQIYRCDADGSRTLIESTPVSSGQATANLQLYTTAYSYSIIIDGTTYQESQYYACHVESTQTKSYTVNILDIDVLPVIGLYLMDCHIENVSATSVRMQWDGNDEDASDIEACIIGYREDIYGRSKVYESCVNESSGTLTRNVALTGFNYYVQGILKQNGVTGYCQETVVFNQRSDTSTSLGITGVLLAAFLIIALALLAAGDNLLVILFSIIAILVIWIIGIMSLNWITVSSTIILGVIIALIGRYSLRGVQ